ncbi:hypothetical protein CDAR_609811 [Caerostris darwini]|uniref:Uncharacterized protein n=1 Tax=Caerostris darwini TaxID=1538125 RepID=A0AAV4VPT4_9ARAC|nr:hypothetical protein CDAR_609811 [Caerostris darwini]
MCHDQPSEDSASLQFERGNEFYILEVTLVTVIGKNQTFTRSHVPQGKRMHPGLSMATSHFHNHWACRHTEILETKNPTSRIALSQTEELPLSFKRTGSLHRQQSKE